MWKTILSLVRSVFTLTQRLEKQEQGLKDLQHEVRELTAVAQRLAFELQRTNDELRRMAEREAGEREKFILQVENRLLKASRELQAPPSDEL